MGPFLPALDPGERKARLRSLRALVKALTGPRGADASYALLRAEISGGGCDADLLREAEAALDNLPPLDRRRVLANYASLSAPELKVVGHVR